MAKLSKETLLKLFRVMYECRLFEETVRGLYRAKELPGWLHQYIGQEAVATGVCLALKKDDHITSTHRGHGHCVAKGAKLKEMIAELYGKSTGCCKGRGGSMHIADGSVGILGANGIVGGGIPIATGAALGNQYLKNNKVVVCFFGDGASSQGSFHESINLASVWKLPVIYLCENNGYAITCSQEKQMNITDIADRAIAYGIPGYIVDGMDVVDVYTNMTKIVEDVRNGSGPVLVEAKTYRFCGHWDGDPEVYREKSEVEEMKKRDPIVQLEKRLLSENTATVQELETIRKQVSKEMDEAVEFGRTSPEPSKEGAMDYVFCE